MLDSTEQGLNSLPGLDAPGGNVVVTDAAPAVRLAPLPDVRTTLKLTGEPGDALAKAK
jgi:hypothetical protein